MQLCLAPPSVGPVKATPSSPIPRGSTFHSGRCERRDTTTVSVPRNVAPKISLSVILPWQLCRFNVNQSTLAAILLPVAAACTVLTACPASVEAGILSGSTGLESFELPSLPTPDILKKIQEANVAKYKAFDANFKKSPFLQDLLKKSKDNKEMHRKETQDKYCERGAEWGVGDCSLLGLPQADKDAFFENLRKGKAGESGR